MIQLRVLSANLATPWCYNHHLRFNIPQGLNRLGQYRFLKSIRGNYDDAQKSPGGPGATRLCLVRLTEGFKNAYVFRELPDP
jgi:hypothetical protein